MFWKLKYNICVYSYRLVIDVLKLKLCEFIFIRLVIEN